jgi:hypothetical protein
MYNPGCSVFSIRCAKTQGPATIILYVMQECLCFIRDILFAIYLYCLLIITDDIKLHLNDTWLCVGILKFVYVCTVHYLRKTCIDKHLHMLLD